MSAFSARSKINLMNSLFQFEVFPQPLIFLGLAYKTGDTEDTLQEPVNIDYNRVPCHKWKIKNRSVTCQGVVTFYTRSEWGPLDHVVLWDALEGGNLLGFSPLSQSIVAADDKVLSLSKDKLNLQFFSQTVSDRLVTMWLTHMFGYIPTTPVQNTSVGLSSSDPRIAITRPAKGYTDVEYTQWNITQEGDLTNASPVLFPTPTGSWGELRYLFILDEYERLLFSAPLVHVLSPDAYNPVIFETGDICFIFD